MDWWRSWHGAPTDLKWLAIARSANVTPAVVVAVAWALFDHASQAEDRGDISTLQNDTVAAFMGCGEDDVDKIINEMIERGMIERGRISAWEKRQPIREDSSRDRTELWRHKRVTSGDAGVTRRDAPDTDTDTDTDTDSFKKFWATYPKKVGKGAALRAYLKAIKKTNASEVLAGAERYAATKPDPKFTKHPATWLNADCWLDEPDKPRTSGVVRGPWKPLGRDKPIPPLTAEERDKRHQKWLEVKNSFSRNTLAKNLPNEGGNLDALVCGDDEGEEGIPGGKEPQSSGLLNILPTLQRMDDPQENQTQACQEGLPAEIPFRGD